MTHPKPTHEEQGSSFTITQFALGSPLQFEPALGSQELDNLISNYVPGSAMAQQKRAQVVLEFLNSIDALSYSHPVSIRYHVPQVLPPQMMPRHSSMPSLNTFSPRASYDYSTIKEETLSTSKSTGSLKRSREEVAPPNASSAKRLPGFSIMTRDGIDITDLASRGPKTKEQRDHAALMRKLKACGACKKSKQRCDPSHHRPTQTALSIPSSTTPSNRSKRPSCVSSAGGSRGSISPQSSLGESFSKSPSQRLSDRAVAQAGQSFPPFPTAKPSLSPSDFTLPETLVTGTDLSALPMQDFDPELFQLADMELDSWNADFTAFPPADNNNSWDSHEDIFTSIHGYGVSPEIQGGSSSEQVRSGSLPHVTTFAQQVLPRQDHQERLTRQPSQLVRDETYPDSHGVEFDIDQWLQSTTDQQHLKESQTQLAAAAARGGMDMSKHNPLQQGSQNSALSRDQDYILYPDSPQIEWGFESHLISRDIGEREWLPRKEAGSGRLSKCHVDKSRYEQDPQGPASAGVIISDSNYHVPGVQPTELFVMGVPGPYLPSPSPSDGSEGNTGTRVPDSNSSETEGIAYDTQDSLSQCSTQSNYAQSRRTDCDSAQLDVGTRQSDASISRNDDVVGYHSVVRRTPLSPGQPQNLRSVITADVNVGTQFQSDQCDNTQFARPQGSPSELLIPEAQNHTMNFLDDQQAQQSLINQNLHAPLGNISYWDQIWKERDLRQAGLLGVPVEANHSSRLHVSSHDMSQVQDTVYGIYNSLLAEAQEQSWRTSISSDLPGEDGKEYFSIESLTQQRLVLDHGNSQQKDSSLPEGPESYQTLQEYSSTRPRSMVALRKKMTTIITLCILMTISLLWTMSLLMSASNQRPESSVRNQGDADILYGSKTQIASANSQNHVRPISFGHDYGSPCQYEPGPGLDHTTSKEDFLYSGPDHVNGIESNPILESGPESETLLADESSISEDYSGHWIKQPTPSPTFSSLSGTPAFTIVPSTTKRTATWMTQLPDRPTPQPKEAFSVVTLQSQRQSSVQSPSFKILTDIKQTWGRRFNIGHLATRITSLTIL